MKLDYPNRRKVKALVNIDPARLATIKDILEGSYNHWSESLFPYAHTHSVLMWLDFSKMASPNASYVDLCEQYGDAYWHIREGK